MLVFKCGGYRVEKVSIRQDYRTSRMQFFVDDLSGNNLRVFNTLGEAKTWITRMMFPELEVNYGLQV